MHINGEKNREDEKAQPVESLDSEELGSPLYASFILRCWIDQSGQTRARLVDVQSGVSHMLNDLDAVSDLVRRLLARTS
ncbi:MAG: hypothetical protein PVI59_16065 [Anaerolineae bacterium]|jgi:hypothetical protein